MTGALVKQSIYFAYFNQFKNHNKIQCNTKNNNTKNNTHKHTYTFDTQTQTYNYTYWIEKYVVGTRLVVCVGEKGVNIVFVCMCSGVFVCVCVDCPCISIYVSVCVCEDVL